MENSVKIPQKKTKTELSQDPVIPLLGIYQDKTKSKRYMSPYVHSCTIYNRQDMEIIHQQMSG